MCRRPWGHWLEREGLVGGGTREGTRAALVPLGGCCFWVMALCVGARGPINTSLLLA